MSLFEQFETNAEKESEGVEIQYGPNKDKTIPTFIISRMGKSNKRYSKALEAATRPYRRQVELGTLKNETAETLFMGVFVDTVLKGWKNVQDRDGTEIPFTKDAATRLLTDLPELYEDLQDKAKSASLFREESLDDEAGN